MCIANKPPGKEAFDSVQLSGSGPHGIGFAERTHAQAPTAGTYVYMNAPEFEEDLVHGKARQHRFKTPASLDTKDDSKFLLSEAIREKTVIPDFLEAGRKDMHHEPANEFTAGKGDLLEGGMVPVVLRHKGDRIPIPINGFHPGVGDSDTVRITPQIINRITEAVKGFPDVRAPGGTVELVFQRRPGGRVRQGGAGRGKGKLPVLMERIQGCKKLSPKLCRKDLCREEEAIAAGAQFSIRGKAASGNDAMDMGMEVQLLPPGMKDLDDTGGGPQKLPVRGKLQESLSRAFMEE